MSDHSSVERAIEETRRGRPVVVVDDEDRENEGDLILAAERATPETIGFFVRYTSGVLCAPMPDAHARHLGLNPMVSRNEAPLGTAFTVSIDYRHGMTTGISAEERANTIRALANSNTCAQDFVRPGHIFPLVAQEGGVLVRSGHTEAAVDLSRLAGLHASAVLCEIVNDDGSLKRLSELRDFAREHELSIVSIADLIAYRRQNECLVERIDESDVMTVAGKARCYRYRTVFEDVHHLAISYRSNDREPVLVRIHREQFVEDLLGPQDPQHDTLFHAGLDRVAAEHGVFVYLRSGGSGVPSRDLTAESVAARRETGWLHVGVGAQILRDLGIRRIRTLIGRPTDYVGVDGYGLAVEEQVLI